MKNRFCTHCKGELVCNTGAVEQCDCNRVVLSNETTAFLGGTYHKCLCNACLEKINGLVAEAKGKPFPTRRSEMIEGVHYYIENGYFVFTELYHLMKGQCCQNGCRHCVYGFKNQHL